MPSLSYGILCVQISLFKKIFLPPSLQRYNWHITLCKFMVCNPIWYTYIWGNDYKKVPFTSHGYLFVCVRTLKTYFLSNFQVNITNYNHCAVFWGSLSFPELTHTWKFVPFYHIHPLSPTRMNHQSIAVSRSWVFCLFFLFKIPHIIEIIQYVSDFFHFA